jgi:predicted nuclease of restriction endonuclease-like (RecB) superfamily
VERLSKDICAEFDGIAGFSPRNMWDMKRFYEQYKFSSKLRQLVAEIPWGHNLLIMNKISNNEEREYYIRASMENGWSRNVLLNQIKANAFARQVSDDKTNNFTRALPAHLAEQADETLKDGYMLDFLGITRPVLERELENRMVEKIRDVLIEFGRGFAFMGNQFRIDANGKEYFIDLLFYHRKLKCLVAIELKAGEFKPEYAGKMNFYLNLLDDFIKEQEENPSIGIILCAEKDNFEVEYSLRNIDKPVGVSEYYLTHELPDKFKKDLPSPEVLKEKFLDKRGEE